MIQIRDKLIRVRHPVEDVNAMEQEMSHIPQALHETFPEATETLHELKTGNAHFKSLAERFETLDEEAKQIENGKDPASDDRLEDIKKHRLAILDEIATMIAAQSAN